MIPRLLSVKHFLLKISIVLLLCFVLILLLSKGFLLNLLEERK
jgi:hypothetical protein